MNSKDNQLVKSIAVKGLENIFNDKCTVVKELGFTFTWVTVDNVEYCLQFRHNSDIIKRFSTINILEWDNAEQQLICLTPTLELDYSVMVELYNNLKRWSGVVK